MTPITPTQIDLNDHIRQMKIQENKMLTEMSGNFVSVTNVSDLLKPDKIRPMNNSAVKPDSGTVFVQDRDFFSRWVIYFSIKNYSVLNPHSAIINSLLTIRLRTPLYKTYPLKANKWFPSKETIRFKTVISI